MPGPIRAARNTIRLVEIVLTLARYDALFPLEQVQGAAPIARLLRRMRRRDPALALLRPGQRLAEAFVALGPGFIKLGQALSLRADLIGEEVAIDLALLQ
ncbi:MAG: 2-polyprenylphenol 6-hydroxylase, partial [Stellaceae bacterium]